MEADPDSAVVFSTVAATVDQTGLAGGAIVSIVINNFNYEQYVGIAIESALRQDYHPVQVVVVDDGSTDGSRDIISRYGDRILAVFRSNGGQGAAYNAGYAACHGQFVIFLDADDRLHPHAVREITEQFRAGTSKVQFNLALIDENGRPMQRSVLRFPPDADRFLHLMGKFLYYPGPPGSGNAYSRWFLEKRMPLPADDWRIQADSYLILAAPIDGKVVHIDECLGDYRRHGGGASDRVARNDVAGYIKKEHEKIVAARQYAARLIDDPTGTKPSGSRAFPPAHLKLTVAELLLCRPAAASFWVRFGLVRHALWTVAGWTLWPRSKRMILPLWVLVACCLPRRRREWFFALSLLNSGY